MIFETTKDFKGFYRSKTLLTSVDGDYTLLLSQFKNPYSLLREDCMNFWVCTQTLIISTAPKPPRTWYIKWKISCYSQNKSILWCYLQSWTLFRWPAPSNLPPWAQLKLGRARRKIRMRTCIHCGKTMQKPAKNKIERHNTPHKDTRSAKCIMGTVL